MRHKQRRTSPLSTPGPAPGPERPASRCSSSRSSNRLRASEVLRHRLCRRKIRNALRPDPVDFFSVISGFH
jgi:hypothetical protein